MGNCCHTNLFQQRQSKFFAMKKKEVKEVCKGYDVPKSFQSVEDALSGAPTLKLKTPKNRSNRAIF
jgi:hypothetical protein